MNHNVSSGRWMLWMVRLLGEYDSKTINCESHFLSHFVLQSFRYVSHLLFLVACSSPLHNRPACSWVARHTLPRMHLTHYLLNACITVGLLSAAEHAVQWFGMPLTMGNKHALPSRPTMSGHWTTVLYLQCTIIASSLVLFVVYQCFESS